MPESNQTSGPDTAAELTRLAGWISEQLGDETADRQWIAESAAAKVRDITLQMLGAAALGRGGAELAARITAAGAVLGDYRSDAARPGDGTDWQSWAYRLASMLSAVLDVAGQAPALSPAQLAVLGQALGDAVTYREAAASDFACADCVAHPAGLCADHAADLDKTDAYLQLARTLGIEVDR